MNRRHLVSSAVLAFAACNVYDSSLLTGGSDAGVATGGAGAGPSPGSGGSAIGGAGGASTNGGASGTGGSAAPEGGEGGDGEPTGGTSTGGNAGDVSGGSGGRATTGGTAGAANGGAAGSMGAGAGGSAGGGAAGASGGGAGGMAGTAGGGAGGTGGSGGSSGPVVQLTGTASADSEQTNPAHPASHGNDGLTATRWCAANGSTGHYWTLDLGAVHPLARFEVIWEYPTSAVGLPYGYVIAVSNDGTTFTTAIDRSTTTNTMQIQTNDFPAATSGRYVRITSVSLPTGAWASFFEGRVFGQ
ncbi:MAG TPA: discoidin domain-containing protein [Polyangiaceae bacterium]